MKESNNKRHILKPLLVFMIICAVLASALIIYVNIYYHADPEVSQYMKSSDKVSVTEWKYGLFFDGNGDSSALIFYPGAKVEYTAYSPLMYKLAENGIDCFLVHMPCNFAFLGSDRASYVTQHYTYDNWYIGGHSIGGAIAAEYVSSCLNDYSGLILLAAYPVSDLHSDKFSVLSIYGDKDFVLNRDNFDTGRKYMPDFYTEICVNGGNHAYFGNYGEQKGDGKSSISREEQQTQTINAIMVFYTTTIN